MLKRYRALILLGIAIIISCIALVWLQLSIGGVSFDTKMVQTSLPRFNFYGSIEYISNLTQQAIETEDSSFIATICREGVGYGYAEFVMPACNRAIELDPQNAYYQDYRGIARLVIEDFAGAQSDFQAYVAWLRQNDLYESQFGVQHDVWIADLQAGRDPLANCRENDMPQFLDCDGLFLNLMVPIS